MKFPRLSPGERPAAVLLLCTAPFWVPLLLFVASLLAFMYVAALFLAVARDAVELLGTCRQPPPGWTCSRPRGHGGPCAARRAAEGQATLYAGA